MTAVSVMAAFPVPLAGLPVIFPVLESTAGFSEVHVMDEPSFPLAGSDKSERSSVIFPVSARLSESMLTLSLSDKNGITLAMYSRVVEMLFLRNVAVKMTNTGEDPAEGLVTTPELLSTL